MVRERSDRRYECSQCGHLLELDTDSVPQVVIHAASGQPNERVISLKGREIHRCRPQDSDWRTRLGS